LSRYLYEYNIQDPESRW